MKPKNIRALIGAFAGVGLAYVSCAAVAWALDPGTWSVGWRLWCVAWAIPWAAFGAIFAGDEA